jgi:autotransporter-associated beta strand protein
LDNLKDLPVLDSSERPQFILTALHSVAAAAFTMLAVSEFSRPVGAAVRYWDTDGSSAGNNASTGANLGGSGNWSATNINWWNPSVGPLQGWASGNDAIFSGTAGAVTASTVSVSGLVFTTNGYSVNSGTLNMTGTATFTVDAGVTSIVSSTIAGTNTMVKLGAGTLILANPANINTANAVAGGWRIEGGGTLHISADESLGAPLPDAARNTVTDIQLNQSTLQAGASFAVSQNRRTKIGTNSSTNRGDAIIDTHGNVLTWYGSLQGGPGSLRVINSGPNPGLLILGTDDINSINPFGSSLPGGTVNLTVQDGAIVQTSGTATPTNGELGSETNTTGEVLAIRLDNGQIRSESGGYFFQRNLILGPGGGSLDVGAWEQTFTGTISGPGLLSKEGGGRLTLDNTSATWTGGTRIRGGTLELGRRGSNGLLPGTLANPSSVVIHSGATLRFNRGSDKSFFDIFSGPGGITVANTPNAIVRLVSDNTYTGPTTINSGTLMIGQGSSSQPGSIVSSVVNNSGTLVFNRVEDLTYAGAVNGTGALTKQAAGRLTLTGTHTYTGATTLSAGTLIVNGTIASSINVSGGTLGGNGTIKGPATVQSAGRLAPGTSIGALTISNTLTLAGVSIMELNATTRTNDLVRGLTTVTYGGTLTLSNLAGTITASNAFKLFSANTYRGVFASLTPAIPGPGLAWNTNTLATDGTLRVVSTSSVTMGNNRSGNLLTLSWPADHISWRLQAQTNSNGVGLSTNWFNVPNSTATNEMPFTLDPNGRCVFYRMIYP